MHDTYILYARKSSESEERQALSIESQVSELRALASRFGLNIAETITEAQSAKKPGRPEFGRMMQMLNDGKATGILAWKLDRLARNPIDGGAVIWAVDTGAIKSIVTPTRTFKKSGDDAFWMQLEFGIAKKYVDDLSDNVKRGLRTRAEAGSPALAQPPLGYLVEPGTKRIVPDPRRFLLVQRVWREILRGTHRPPEVFERARNEWGLTTVPRGKLGGRPPGKTTLYHLLENPFYAGVFTFDGKQYKGTYQAMITMAEFLRARAIIGTEKERPKTPEPSVYRGFLRCGACGRLATTERKTNRYGSRYVYYHCARSLPWYDNCREPAIEERAADVQMVRLLGHITLQPEFARHVEEELHTLRGEQANFSRVREAALKRKLADYARELSNLTQLRLRDRIGDDEFERTRTRLMLEHENIEQRLAGVRGNPGTIEPLREAIFSATLAKKRFAEGSTEEKRRILAALLSNLSVQGGILRITAKKPFQLLADLPRIPGRSGCRELNPVYIHPMDAYYRYTTPRIKIL